MKAIPISQYLEHLGARTSTGREAARDDGSPLRPRSPLRAIPFAPSFPTAELSRLPGATLFRTLSERREEGGSAQGRGARPHNAWMEGHVIPEGQDIERRLADAFERGRKEGLEAGRVEVAQAHASELRSAGQRALEETRDFQANEYAQLAERIDAALGEIEHRIGTSVSRILAPYLMDRIAGQAVDELCQVLARLRAWAAPGMIRIRGPERLLGKLRERVLLLFVDVEFTADDGVDITVEAQDTLITTALKPWADLLASSGT
jgi:hypothetical protein